MARSSPEHVPPEKMDNIMRAAVVEFARYPFNTASYNRIIRSAGLSKGAMYHYFSSKEDLFRLIMGATVKGLKPLIKPGPLPHDEQLYWLETERLLESLFRFLGKQPALGRFILTVLGDPDRAKETPAGPLMEELNEWLRDFLVCGQTVGAVRRDWPDELLLVTVWGGWRSAGEWLSQRSQEQGTDPLQCTAVLLDYYARLLQPE